MKKKLYLILAEAMLLIILTLYLIKVPSVFLIFPLILCSIFILFSIFQDTEKGLIAELKSKIFLVEKGEQIQLKSGTCQKAFEIVQGVFKKFQNATIDLLDRVFSLLENGIIIRDQATKAIKDCEIIKDSVTKSCNRGLVLRTCALCNNPPKPIINL